MLNLKRIGIVLALIVCIALPMIVFANENNGDGIFTFSKGDEVTSIDTAIEVLNEEKEKQKIENADATAEKTQDVSDKAQTDNKPKTAPTVAKKQPLSSNANDMIYYMMKKNGSISKATATKIYDSVMKHSKTYNVDPALVFAIMEQESTFNPNTSYQGAYGLMQLYHTTLPYLGISRADVFDIDKNIRAGVYEISGNLKRYGDETIALTAYNWGSGNVSRGNYTTKYAKSVQKRKVNLKSVIN